MTYRYVHSAGSFYARLSPVCDRSSKRRYAREDSATIAGTGCARSAGLPLSLSLSPARGAIRCREASSTRERSRASSSRPPPVSRHVTRVRAHVLSASVAYDSRVQTRDCGPIFTARRRSRHARREPVRSCCCASRRRARRRSEKESRGKEEVEEESGRK